MWIACSRALGLCTWRATEYFLSPITVKIHSCIKISFPCLAFSPARFRWSVIFTSFVFSRDFLISPCLCHVSMRVFVDILNSLIVGTAWYTNNAKMKTSRLEENKQMPTSIRCLTSSTKWRRVNNLWQIAENAVQRMVHVVDVYFDLTCN